MPMKRALSILFIFLFIGSVFTIIPFAHADSPTTYIVQVYDNRGVMLNNSSSIIQTYAKIEVRAPVMLPIPHIKTIAYGSGSRIAIKTNSPKILVIFYWMDSVMAKQWLSTSAYTTDKNGTKIIPLNLGVTPAIPIPFVSESMEISGDIHEINTAYYDVKFGTDTYKNGITMTIGGNQYTMDVSLDFSFNGSNPETKPFKFLAQSTSGYVEGDEKFLVWTTAKYWSAVRTAKVGDNMFLVVWTYGYADVAGAWVSKVIAATLAGAVLGATTGPEGALMGGAIGGMASAIAWAVKPDLVDLSAHTGMGVVVGLFTPRYFIIQGAGGYGAKKVQSTLTISGEPASGRFSYKTLSYEINSQSNTVQVGFTKDYGTSKTYYYDFEDGKIPSNFLTDTSKNHIISKSQSSSKVHTGQYSYYSGEAPTYILLQKATPGQYKIDVDLYSINNVNDYEDFYIKIGYQKDGGWYNDTFKQTLDYYWKERTVEDILTIPENTNGLGYIYVEIAPDIDNNGFPIIDDVKISVQNTNGYRYIFETGTSTDNAIIRHMFGTIPTIAPSNVPVSIHARYTLLAIDVQHKGYFLGMTWDSRPISGVSVAKIIVKTDTWQETAYLLGTDDKNGFSGVSIILSPANYYLYHADFEEYYLFTSPDNWTAQLNWTPLMANNTMIYIPNWDSVNWNWEKIHWDLAKWWEEIGPWAHLALLGLAAFIIFIIILIVAPWLIFALIKILGLILKGLFTAIGMAAKGAGKMLGKRRRKK